MYDSQAWKPWLFLPFVVFLIIGTETGVVLWVLENLGRFWLVLVGLLAFLCIVRFFRKEQHTPYTPPIAEYISPYHIAVFGDVDRLQREAFRSMAVRSWTHLGHKKWLIELDNVSAGHARELVDAINTAPELRWRNE